MTPEGTVLGYVLTAKHDPLVRSFPTLEQHPAIAVLRWFDVDTYRTPQRDPRELLCEEIRQICLAGWHCPRKLKKKGGTPIPYKGRNAGGLTFEALLDIPENPVSQPDKHGHEIKTFSGSKISLFTPAPDGGIRCQYKTNDDFLRDWGWSAVRKPGQSLVFNGTHCCTKANSKFGSRLILEGYDPQTDEFVREREQIRVILRDGRSQGELFAWSFHKLADKWEKKHSLAVYVQSIKNKSTGDYRFERNIYLCSGTTIWHFFKALAKGVVVYDPAHEFGVNERHQWRISSAKSKMKERLELLYDHVEIKDVTKM